MSHTSRGRRRLAGLTLLALVTAGVLALVPHARAPRALADDSPAPTPAPTPAPGAGCRLGLLVGAGYVTLLLPKPPPPEPARYRLARMQAEAAIR